MPSSLIKFTQGATTDVPGRALKGDADGATAVVVSNGDDTGVVSWTFELLYVPPSSGLVPTTQGPSGVATFSMGIPDVPGCYRVRMTTTDIAGLFDIDIRNFAVPFPNTQVIVPPYQANPPPLPLTGVGAKPDEMNFGGQAFGWDGDDDLSRRLVYQAIKMVDAGGWIEFVRFQTTDATPVVTTFMPAGDLKDGDYEVEISVIGREDPSTGDHGVFWRRAAFEVTSTVVTQIGATQTPAADLLDGAGTWAVALGATSAVDVDSTVTGAVGDTVDWVLRYKVRSTA